MNFAWIIVFSLLVQQVFDGADLRLQMRLQLQQVDHVAAGRLPVLERKIGVDQADAGTGRLVGGIVVLKEESLVVAFHGENGVERLPEKIRLLVIRLFRSGPAGQTAKFAFDLVAELSDRDADNVGDGEEPFHHLHR